MASVFLSYDREDGDKARLVALALERAGHSVWWDRHIKGGAQYSKEIEQALNRADGVVVLWSERSVDSAWVRDEATAGRDSGRLIPVRLDQTEPPMGFRQYQTIDLSRWKGRSRSPALDELLGAIGALGENSATPTPQKKTPAKRDLQRLRPMMIGIVLAVLAAVALVAWQPWRQDSSVPVVAVAPADGSDAARALANDLFVKLGSLQAANADLLQLVDHGSAAQPDLTFRMGASAQDGQPRATLALMQRDAATLLWSREYVQPGGNQADLRQQVAYSAAQVLECAIEALSGQHRRVPLPTLKLYLNGCADFDDQLSNPALLIATFRKVTQQAPNFAGGWAKLLLAEIEAFRLTDLSDPALRNDLRTHLKQARRLNPTMAETYLVEAWTQSPRPINGWMRFVEMAVKKNPQHPEALASHSLGMFHVGRVREAVSDARRAARSNPLSPVARESLMNALVQAGELEAAMGELREAERLWPGASNLLSMRFFLTYRFGDPGEALRILRSGGLDMPLTPARESFLKARIDTSAANIASAIEHARSRFEKEGAFGEYVQVLAEFGRTDELASVLLSVDPRIAPGVVALLFRPAFAPLHKDPRFLQIAERFGLIEYWRETGKWPDFCVRADLPYDCKTEAAKVAA